MLHSSLKFLQVLVYNILVMGDLTFNYLLNVLKKSPVGFPSPTGFRICLFENIFKSVMSINLMNTQLSYKVNGLWNVGNRFIYN